MPVFPKIEIETARWCNLRQALQWLKDEIRPVEPLYEPIVGVTADINGCGIS